MKFDDARLEGLKPHFTDEDNGCEAPLAMWGPHAALLGDEDVIASFAQQVSGTDHTTWRLVWVTETRLIYSTASRNQRQWDADDFLNTADSATTYCAPLREVASVVLSEQSVSPVSRTDLEWTVTATISFRDGMAVRIPAERAKSKTVAAAEVLVQAIAAML